MHTTRLSVAQREQFLYWLREGLPVSHVGDSRRRTFYAARQRDPEFAQAWDEAVEDGKVAVEFQLALEALIDMDPECFPELL